MKISEWEEAKKWLVRPKNKFRYEPWANKKVERLNTGGAVAPVTEPQKMNIVDYIQTMNRLYNSDGGAVKKAEAPHGTEPGYIDPKEMEDIKKSLPVSEMVKKPKKQIIKKTLIVEKPRPVKPPIIDYLELQDWLNEIDPNWTDEKPNEKVLLRVPKRELKGLASLLNVG
jgi:hypothetical protein